jgi:antitoxin FitA
VTTITIRNVDENVKRQIKMIAASNGRSMEAELREILKQVATGNLPPKNIGQSIRRRFAKIGGVDLDLPKRSPMRKLPDIGK